ncbi:MAG: hypothetical protein WAN31_02815 [Methylovirgula sp.]
MDRRHRVTLIGLPSSLETLGAKCFVDYQRAFMANFGSGLWAVGGMIGVDRNVDQKHPEKEQEACSQNENDICCPIKALEHRRAEPVTKCGPPRSINDSDLMKGNVLTIVNQRQS